MKNNDEQHIEFTKIELDTDKKPVVKSIRTLRRSSIQKCPHAIMVADHYREDETCRCDEPDNKDMIEWGYSWNGRTWS